MIFLHVLFFIQGFSGIRLATWAEAQRKRTLRSGLGTATGVTQMHTPILSTRGIGSRDELGEPKHQLAETECDRSNQGTHQSPMELGRSARLGTFSHYSPNDPEQGVIVSPYLEKSSDLASSSQPALIDNSNVQEIVPVVLPNTEDNGRAHSITLTELARAGGCNSSEDDEVEGPALVTVAGCTLKEEFAATARIIEKNHGDILVGNSYEGPLRNHLFENVCAVYQKLEKVEFIDLKLPELDSMQKQVRDLLKTNVDVGWLAKRLDEIHHAKDFLLAAPNMKEQRIKKQKMISELEKNVQEIQSMLHELENKLESAKEDAAKIRGVIQAKNEIMRFHKKSLVEGI